MKLRRIIKYINRHGGIDFIGYKTGLMSFHRFPKELGFSYDNSSDWLLLESRKHLKRFIQYLTEEYGVIPII